MIFGGQCKSFSPYFSSFLFLFFLLFIVRVSPRNCDKYSENSSENGVFQDKGNSVKSVKISKLKVYIYEHFEHGFGSIRAILAELEAFQNLGSFAKAEYNNNASGGHFEHEKRLSKTGLMGFIGWTRSYKTGLMGISTRSFQFQGKGKGYFFLLNLLKYLLSIQLYGTSKKSKKAKDQKI